MDSSILICTKCNDSDTRLWNHLIENNAEPKIVFKYSIGNFIKIDDNMMVLSCYHGIQNYIEIYLYQFKKNKTGNYIIKKIQAELKCFSDELDLVLLSTNKKLKIDTFIELKDLSFNLTIHNLNLVIKYDVTKKISEDEISKQNKIMNLKVDNILFEKYNSFNMPKLPYIACEITDLTDDKISIIKGLSGILAKNKDNVITGMLINYNREDNNVRLIPSIIINEFLTKYRSTGKYDGINGVVFKPSFCEFINNNKKYNGIIVNDLYNNKCFQELKKEDVIFKINGNKIEKNNMIFHEVMTINVPYDTYMALSDINIKLSVMRFNEQINDYKEIDINIKSENISKLRNIQINHNNKYYNVGGFIFCELTENMIEFYRNHNIHIIGEAMNRYTKYGYYEQSKTIILANLLSNEFDKTELTTIFSKGLPLIKKNGTKNEFYICVLQSLNKKKILNLEDIEKNLLNDKNSFKFVLDDNIKLNVNYSNTNLSITYIVK